MRSSISLPLPTLAQASPINSKAKRKVLNCGRRSGKTEYFASFESVPRFLGFRIECNIVDGEVSVSHIPIQRKSRILYGAPTDDQTMVYWEKITKHLHPLIKGGFVYRNKTKRYVEWLSGGEGRIKAKTAWDADSWRGDHGDLLLYDEWAYMDEEAFSSVGIPMLLDNNGSAIFGSTPNRKNHHFAYFNRGIDEFDKRWESFKFTSHDNPHLSKEALSELTQDLTDDNYRQEIMAEFLENEGAVFRNIEACMNAQPTRPNEHKGHHLVAGVDWGKHKDFTVISVGCRTCGYEVHLDRFNKIDYSYQRGRLANIINEWGIVDSLVELNSIGEPNFEELERGDLPVRGFQTTAGSKRPLIEGLGLALERETWQFLDVPIATAELEAYEIKVHPVTGHATYSAPAGVHDDTVMARALMVQAVNSYMPAFL